MANPNRTTKQRRDAKGHFITSPKKSKENDLREQVARLHALLSVEEKREERTEKYLEAVRAELNQVKRDSLKYRNFAFHPISGEPFQKLFWNSQYAFRCALDDWKKESRLYHQRDSEQRHELESNRETIKNLQTLLKEERDANEAERKLSRSRLVKMIILATGLVVLAAYVLIH